MDVLCMNLHVKYLISDKAFFFSSLALKEGYHDFHATHASHNTCIHTHTHTYSSNHYQVHVLQASQVLLAYSVHISMPMLGLIRPCKSTICVLCTSIVMLLSIRLLTSVVPQTAPTRQY